MPLAVFKTVCGAVLSRPRWVRFPSIPARAFQKPFEDDVPRGLDYLRSALHAPLAPAQSQGCADSQHLDTPSRAITEAVADVPVAPATGRCVPHPGATAYR